VTTQHRDEEDAVDAFLHKHADKITGVLSCFDRLIFKGYLPCSYPKGMEGFLQQQGILLKDFRAFALKQSALLKDHARRLAEDAGRPFIPLQHKIRKEEQARQLIRQHNLSDGLVCVFAVQEMCPSFKIAYGQGRPCLNRSYPRCLVLYFYYLDPEFGLIHLRLPTWFPFTVQVYLNGHEWLARQLHRHGIGHQQRDNAFLAIDDLKKAQELADQLTRKKCRRFLDALGKRINPLMKSLFKKVSYYWVTDQAEYATDVMFKDRQSLQGLYQRLLQHATLMFSAEDVLGFLGKKLHPCFAGELTTDCKKRPQGFRVKHRYDGNWLKMYDKFGQVLRIEMVVNRPRRFKVFRYGTAKGQRLRAWFPLTKSVAFLGRYAEVSRQATHRYLDALAVVEDPQVSARVLERACNPVPFQGRRKRALNPLSRDEQQLFFAVLRGEHCQRGFYSRDVAKYLKQKKPTDPREQRRQSDRVGRLLQLLRAHGLIRKLQRTRRYKVTDKGFAFMSAAIHLRHRAFPADMAG
jgi:hypothetical protein